MTHTVEFDSNENLIIAQAQGDTYILDLVQLLNEIIVIAKQVNCFKILTRLDQANLNVNTIDYYTLPDIVRKTVESHGVNLHNFKRALVCAKDQQVLEFYQLVSHNRGNETKLFHNVQEAKAWLQTGQE